MSLIKKFQYLLLLICGCSVNSSVLHDNFGIVGGSPINITDAPYMALFRSQGKLWGCGASIIHQRFLVTAAHCCKDISKPFVTVGTDNVNSGDKYEIENIYVHPKYTRQTANYDIAVLKLKKQLKWSNKVKLIEIADSHDFDNVKNGEMLTTMGFGITETETGSEILLRVEVPYIDRTTCEKELDPSIYKITPQMFCAGGVGGKDSCRGDSGGPIVYKGKLAGAVSWGIRCAVPRRPGVYAYLPAMRDFVDTIIKTK